METDPDCAHQPSVEPLLQRLCCLLSLCVAFLLAPFAQPVLADSSTDLHAVLDGKMFQSQLGVKGGPGDIDDLLVFDDGEFVSEECERRCGYAKVEYWVRAEGDAVQMRADVPCTESGAVMYWRGTVRGDEIEGSIIWVNKRWYWTFEKELWFKGRLVKAQQP